ncbi:MAG: hypothetical protein IJX89_01460 [Alphaproteobacteria bacterium]|nr:hypothetical protein [Alphaproteobacteria bacterium]
MAVWLRVLANPKVLKRFLGTKAGKRAAFKYGSMLVKSKTIQNAIGKFMNNNGEKLQSDKDYKKLAREYASLQQKIAKLEGQIDAQRNNNEKIQTLTFTMGRTVVEMQRLYAQMQTELQRLYQNQMTMTQKTR